MESRKLQKTGGSSLSLVLPKKWTEAQTLKDKDEVRLIIQQSGNLLITPLKKQQTSITSSIAIDQLSKGELIRELIAHYLMGVDTIHLTSKKMTALKRTHIREGLEFLIGFTIVDESGEKTVIKNIFDSSKFPVIKNVDTMLDITKLMFIDALRAVEEHDEKLARDVIARDFEVDKLHFMITRQYHALLSQRINESDLNMSSTDLSFYERVSSQIERIADHCTKIAELTTYFKAPQKKLIKNTLGPVIDELSKLLQITILMVKTHDKKTAHQLLEQTRNLEKDIPRFTEKLQHAPLLLLVTDSLDRLRGYMMNIAELTLDQAIMKEIN